MSNVDDEIVSMQFDNKQFESGVATSIGTLDKLKSSLQFSGAGTGLSEMDRAVKGFSLNPISAGIQGVNKAWLGMTTIAVTAIGNITNKAVDAGLRMGKALTLDPIKAGFQNYETKINAVQTILANTADQGTNLKQVTGTLNQLNTYANKTVYNFSEMAKNIGTFTAAGVDLKTSTSSIKGIANLAALSGSTSEQASSAMYQLSQAIAAGQVHLQDWNSVVNAGIGGAVFQKNLINTALATGTLDKNQVHLGKTMADTTINGVAFRQSLTPPPGGTSWLTSGVLTKSLGTFTGDMTKAQLAAQGFSKEQIKAIQAQAKTASNAATQIKTFSQLFQALKEEVGTAYAAVFEALFGNINQAKKFLSPLHTAIENALTKPIYAVANALKSWRKAGGFDDILTIFKNLGTIVGNLLYPLTFIFGSLLPSTKNAGKGLEGVTKAMAEFTGWIAKGTDGIRNLYLPLRLVVTILKAMGGYVKLALDQFKKLSFLSDIVGNAFSGVSDQAEGVGFNLIHGLYNGIVGNQETVKKSIVDLANNMITWIKDTLGIHSPASTMVPIGLNIIQGIVEGLTKGAQFLITALQKIFIGLGQVIKYAVANISWGDVLDTINTGLFLGLILIFKRFVDAFTGTLGQFKELIEKGGGVLDQMTANLKTMQQKVKSEVIRNIAISIAILAASAFLLAQVDGKKLGVSLGAIAGMMTTLLGVMYALGGGGSKGKHVNGKAVARQTASLLAMSAALIAFATSVLILTAAVALMGQLKPKTIERGLAGIAGVIALMVATTAILGKTGGGATILATATAMTIMAGALVAFVGVMKLYEKLDWKTLVRGGGSAAAVILAVGLAMKAFSSGGAIGGATGLVIASAALVVLAKAMQMLASIGLGDMIKSVIALDVVLGSLTVAAEAMSAAEGGAGSMLVMAAAIIVLAIALKILSKIPMLDLLKAIGALVVSLALIAGAAILLAPAVPLIAALGSAVLLLGLAVLSAGVGVLAFATAIGILAVVGPAGFQAVHDGILQLLDILPQIGEAMAGFVLGFVTGLLKAAQPLVQALEKLLGLILDGLAKLIPKVQTLVQKVINAIFEVIIHSYGHAAKVMLNFILNMLSALSDGVPKMIKKGTDLIVGVISGLAKADVRIANATGRAILTFLQGLDKAIVKYERPIVAEGVKIAGDLVTGLVNGLKSSLSWNKIKSAVESMASAIPGWARKVLGMASPSKVMRDEVGKWIPLGVAEGIDTHVKSVEKSSENLAKKSLDAMKMTFRNSKNAAGNLIDLAPKVTPVLDLTQLQKDATQIGGMMGRHSIDAKVSRSKARDISANQNSNHDGSDGHKVEETYNFNQTINSPKAVDHVAVYRGTRSQIALFKEVTKK